MSLHAKAVGMLAVRRREQFTPTTKITTVRSPPPTPCCKKVSRAQKKKSIGCNSHRRRALRSPTEQRCAAGSKGPRHVAALGSAVVTALLLPVQDGSCDGVLLVTMAENNSVKRDPQGAPTLTRGRGITRVTESRYLPPPGSLELAQSNAGASGNSNRTTTVETRSNRSKRRTRTNNNSAKSVVEASAQSPSGDIVDNSDVISEQRPAAEGSSHSDQEQENSEHDPETEELARLRCPSERTEVIAERETRRRQRRCADYPGFAFGSSIFGSDTLMKFNIIRNELQNIKNSQLKRAESEVAALNRRIQLLEEDLERSEERLATATAKLAEASQAADESERIRKALENRTNMEDDRVAILEAQLSQAKQIAEEADKKYEEVARKLVLMEQDLERAEERAEQSDSKIVELEEELRVVGNNLKSLEVSEEKATATKEHCEDKIHLISDKLREAEARAEFAERSVQKLQKEVDRLEDDLLAEKEKNKLLQEEMEATLHDIQNM